MARRIASVIPTEAQEQKALFEWAEAAQGKYPALRYMFHIPNGGSRNMIEARHLKEQGVKAGVPDIFLPCPNTINMGLFIELKRRERGTVSKAQAMWIFELNSAGYRAVVCKGWEEARDEIIRYLSVKL